MRMKRRVGRHLLGGVVVGVAAVSMALVGAVPVSAGDADYGGEVTVTHDEAAFLAANKIWVTQTFDEAMTFPAEKRAVTFQGVRFWSKDTADPYWRVGGVEGAEVQCPEVCRLYRAFSDGPNDTADMALSFRNHGAVRSFGFLLNVFGSPNQFVIRVQERDGTVSRIWLPSDVGDIYLGLHSRIGIDRIVIHQRPDKADGSEVNFAIDQFSRSFIIAEKR
jgi:hypothetical protein